MSKPTTSRGHVQQQQQQQQTAHATRAERMSVDDEPENNEETSNIIRSEYRTIREKILGVRKKHTNI